MRNHARFLWAALLVGLSACFQPAPSTPQAPANSVDSKSERLSEAGGTLTLKDGSFVTIPSGFLDTSADVTFYSSTEAPAVDPAKGFNVAAHQAIGYRYTLGHKKVEETLQS